MCGKQVTRYVCVAAVVVSMVVLPIWLWPRWGNSPVTGDGDQDRKSSGKDVIYRGQIYSGCGGIVYSVNDHQYIQYRSDSTYGANERCAWVIVSSVWNVELAMLEEDFVPNHSGLVLCTVSNGQDFHCSKWDSEHATITGGVIHLKTPAVVYFTSDNVTTGRGFTIKFRSRSRFPRVLPSKLPKVTHTKQPSGFFSVSDNVTQTGKKDEQQNNRMVAATLLFQPKHVNEWTYFRIGQRHKDMKTEACSHTATAYEIFPVHANTGEASALNADLNRWIDNVHGPLTMITKETVLVLISSNPDFGCYVEWGNGNGTGRGEAMGFQEFQ